MSFTLKQTFFSSLNLGWGLRERLNSWFLHYFDDKFMYLSKQVGTKRLHFQDCCKGFILKVCLCLMLLLTFWLLVQILSKANNLDTWYRLFSFTL